jgi:hypothetical protein
MWHETDAVKAAVAPVVITPPAIVPPADVPPKPLENPPRSAKDENPPPPGAVIFPGEAAPAPIWPVAALLPFFVLAGLAVLIHASRPYVEADADTPEFLSALRHWAAAAYDVHASPREMKRFLNHLRFAAAGGSADLPGPLLVGLAVIAQADASIIRRFVDGDADMLNALRVQANFSPAVARIVATADPADLTREGLPIFSPTPEQARRFLGFWDGVSVRA